MNKEERREINHDLANHRYMDRKRAAELEIMKATPDLLADYNKIVNCSFHRPCNKPTCNHCGGGMPHRRSPGQDYMYDQKAIPSRVEVNQRTIGHVLLHGCLNRSQISLNINAIHSPSTSILRIVI